jgi:hypothetical protein
VPTRERERQKYRPSTGRGGGEKVIAVVPFVSDIFVAFCPVAITHR